MGRPKKPKPQPSSTGGAGPRDVDQSTWRTKLRQSRIKFDDPAKEVFIEEFTKRNLVWTACQAAGVAESTVRTHLENDPEFAERYAEAKLAYKAKILGHARSLMEDGVDEPIVGGLDRDQIVAYKRSYPINLIAMEMRRVEPDYKERTEIDLNAGGGVLVAPAGKTPEQWIKEQEEKNASKDAPPVMEDSPPTKGE